ncbi:TetR/AcrR family transcriptional regulator C-terminal domain-containing protein [Kitasatospora sp. NPDC057904]|uniref:TetR/AcrR family transcriptional regulator C-terminal domain-containing protein n=1 Tax=Kitasatospora sp. NPDC057904 TaxID=3346275 RepID=UPI0036DCA030
MAAQPAPPFRRIADEIARRITEGTLVPGDRVPSTRQIAREWGVALATATKVLTALRLEGLVEAKPRVGTVVAAKDPVMDSAKDPARGPGKRPAKDLAAPAGHTAPDRELTRERIVRAAVEIADGEGLGAVSMRSVAARLGVAAMSPYRHVNGKDDLVVLMADAAYGEETYPAEAPEGWRARLELGARMLWRIHRRHPWLAQVGSLTRPLLAPALMVHAEWALAALDGHGLAPETMLDLHVLLYSHVHGIAVHLEREAQAQAATGLSEDQWMDRQAPAFAAITGAARYPVFTRIASGCPDGYDLDLDALFEFGLKPLLDGIAVMIEAPPSNRARTGG